MRAYAIHLTGQWSEEDRNDFDGVEGFYSNGLFFERRYPKGEEPVAPELKEDKVTVTSVEVTVPKTEASWQPWTWFTNLFK